MAENVVSDFGRMFSFRRRWEEEEDDVYEMRWLEMGNVNIDPAADFDIGLLDHCHLLLCNGKCSITITQSRSRRRRRKGMVKPKVRRGNHRTIQ